MFIINLLFSHDRITNTHLQPFIIIMTLALFKNNKQWGGTRPNLDVDNIIYLFKSDRITRQTLLL